MEAIAIKRDHPKQPYNRLPAIGLLLLCWLLAPTSLLAQCAGSQAFYQELSGIEHSSMPDKEKLAGVSALEHRFMACKLPPDSVLARILHRLGTLQGLTGNRPAAIQSTQRSIAINTSGRPAANRKLVLTSYYNLGFFYLNEGFYTAALAAFDHCVAEGKQAQDSASLVKTSAARQKKGFIFHQLGDDQKDIYETTLGLRTALRFRNNTVIVDLYNERAQASASLQQMPAALADLDRALGYISPTDYNARANNYKGRGNIMVSLGNWKEAMRIYDQVIDARAKGSAAIDLDMDLLDAGNVLLKQGSSPGAAATYYRKALQLARTNGHLLVAGKALNNLALLAVRSADEPAALQLYQQSLGAVLPDFAGGLLSQPTYRQINGASKVFLYQLLGNRTECLLHLFKRSGNCAFLRACMQSARLTDSVITGMRQEQTEELSKLHWLQDAKSFFTAALEACYLSADHATAFYFMEKSRSVLLNDKLNRLGANALLPPAEAAREQDYQLKLLSEQQELWKLAPSEPAYHEQESRYLLAREQFETWTRSLQEAYPVYYQAKWADQMPTQAAFQEQLKGEEQSFVHYFVSDTCIYILCTTPTGSQMVRQCLQSTPLLREFLLLCADKQTLNHGYSRFAALSHQLYGLLFAPLRLPTRRVVICTDNFLLPFDALTTDTGGHRFLVDRFVFSYAYSARSEMKVLPNVRGDGDCLLVAPGHYAAYLNVSNLEESTRFLEASREPYGHTRLLKGSEATKAVFMEEFSRYTIVNIYSHATADSTNAEPFLYLCDSVVRLSQLEMLNRPSTQLVILSACETSAGRKADGEGIYSLARGFAAVGIPAIASTLWKADAKATSEITTLFHRNLARGMRKDEALQQAKRTFMQQHDRDQQLPFYWANLILAGDPSPLQLAPPTHRSAWAAGMAGVLLLAGGWLWLRRKKTSYPLPSRAPSLGT